jgi:hypothetical protein
MIAEEFYERHAIVGPQTKGCTSCGKDFSGASEYFQESAQGPSGSAKLCRKCIEVRVYRTTGCDATKIKAEVRGYRAKYTRLAHGRYASTRMKADTATPKRRADREGDANSGQKSRESTKRPLEMTQASCLAVASPARVGLDDGRSSRLRSRHSEDAHSVYEFEEYPSLFKHALELHNLRAALVVTGAKSEPESLAMMCFQEHAVRSTHRDPCAQCGADFNELKSYFRVTGLVKKFCRACVEKAVKGSAGVDEEEILSSLRLARSGSERLVATQ